MESNACTSEIVFWGELPYTSDPRSCGSFGTKPKFEDEFISYSGLSNEGRETKTKVIALDTLGKVTENPVNQTTK